MQVLSIHLVSVKTIRNTLQFCLVDIQMLNIYEQDDSKQCITSKNHYNLVVLKAGRVVVFDPQPSNNVSFQVLKMIAGQFPLHNVIASNAHPQTAQNDDFCMIYVCLLAEHLLTDRTSTKSVFAFFRDNDESECTATRV